MYLSIEFLQLIIINIEILEASMRAQIRKRLQTQAKVEVAQSRVFDNDQSFIHELRDLIQDDHQPNEHTYFTDKKVSHSYKTGLHSTHSFGNLKHLRMKNEINNQLNSEKIQANLYSRKKVDTYRNSQDLPLRQHGILNFEINQIQRKRFQRQITLPTLGTLQQKKQSQNVNMRIKFHHNRSSIVKNQEIIKKLVLNKCQHCGEVKSQVYRSKIVCKNKRCRLINLYQDYQTFPIIGMLYDIQNPSCSCQQLEQFINKIKQQVSKIQRWRNDLIELQFQIRNIVQSKKQFHRNNKNQLKNIVSSVSQLKSRRTRQNQQQLTRIQNQIQKLQLRSSYEQFNRWNKIDLEKFQNSKFVVEYIQQYKPLCLKPLHNQIAEQICDLSDGFNNLSAMINTSEYLAFNLFGNISLLILSIDGSIQLKRENFLLIQKVHQLQLNFKSRKTSRELRQLFNILPNIKKLSFDFDYKTHSHLSCQAFPLLTKALEIAEESVKINLYNARPQIFDDLRQMSKKMAPKLSLELKIEMNPFIQGEQCIKNIEWGTKVTKNIIKNLGTKTNKIHLQFPFQTNHQQISELILNSDFNMLIDLKLKSKQTELRVEKQNNMKQLLQSIIRKKKLLMSYLLNQKRQKSHPLNKDRILLESVYQVLF